MKKRSENGKWQRGKRFREPEAQNTNQITKCGNLNN